MTKYIAAGAAITIALMGVACWLLFKEVEGLKGQVGELRESNRQLTETVNAKINVQRQRVRRPAQRQQRNDHRTRELPHDCLRPVARLQSRGGPGQARRRRIESRPRPPDVLMFSSFTLSIPAIVYCCVVMVAAYSARGASGFGAAVAMPLLMPAIAAGSIFTFSLSLGDYIVPQLVNNGKQRFMFGTIINSTLGAPNQPLAAAYTLWPLLIVLLYLFAMKRLGAFERM